MNVNFIDSKIKTYVLSFNKSSLSKSLRLIGLLKTFGNSLGMPYSKKLLPNLYELRIRGRQEIRIFYCFHQDQAIIVHAFIKKSQKTPQKEIKTALNKVSLLTS